MSVPMNVIDAKMPAITELVNGFVSIIKNNNDTKVALAKIEADLHKRLKEIDLQHIKEIDTIKIFSSLLDTELSKNDISYEDKLAVIDKFVNAMLEVVNNN